MGLDITAYRKLTKVDNPTKAQRDDDDFAEWDDRARAHDDQPWFYDAFTAWRKAFEMAADGGAVDFH
jgi:hypothetical protein